MSKEYSRFTSKDVLAVIGVFTLIALLMLTGGVILKYGMFPLLDFIFSLVSLSAYQKGVVDTVVLGIALILFLMSISLGPRR